MRRARPVVAWALRFGRWRAPPAVGALVALMVLNNLATAAWFSLLPVYVEKELRHPPTFTATLFAVEAALGGAAALLGGFLADSWGRKTLLLAGLTGFCAATLAFTVRAPWLLLILAVVLGVAHGFRSTGGQSYLLGAARAGIVGVATAAFFLGGTAGAAAGSALAGAVIEAGGFALFGWSATALALLPVLVGAWWLPDVGRGRRPVRATVLTHFGAMLRRREIQVLGALRYLPTVWTGVWQLALPLLVFRASGNVAVTAAYSATSLIGAAILPFAVGGWSDRRGLRGPTLLSLSGMLGAAAVLAVWHPALPVLFIAGTFGMACAQNMSLLVLGGVRVCTHDEERGRAVGFVHALWSAGLFSGSLVTGALVDLHPAMPFGGAAAVTAVALAVAVVWFRPHRHLPGTRPVSGRSPTDG